MEVENKKGLTKLILYESTHDAQHFGNTHSNLLLLHFQLFFKKKKVLAFASKLFRVFSAKINEIFHIKTRSTINGRPRKPGSGPYSIAVL